MKKALINIPEGIYFLGDYPELLQKLPTSTFILNKVMTGCGATTLFLEDNIPTVLCSPRKELIHCKASSNRHFGRVHAFGYEAKCTGTKVELIETGASVIDKINAMKDYVSQRLPHPLCPPPAPKIIVTYDSCKHVIQGLHELGVLGYFRFVVDEFQTLWTDAQFRGDIEAEFTENLKCTNQVIYLSATPYIEGYLDQLDEFKDLPFIELNWPQSSLHYTSTIKRSYLHGSPAQTIEKIINDYRQKGYFNDNILDAKGNPILATQVVFYVNDVKFITDTIRKNGLQPNETLVICGDTDENLRKLKAVGMTIGHAPKEGALHPPFTFCSRSAFEGVDLYHPNGLAIIFSDISKDHLAVDISLCLPQIYGRLRVSPYRYNAIFYCKTLPNFSDEDKKEFDDRIKQKADSTNVNVLHYQSITEPTLRASMARKYRISQKVERYENDYTSVVDDKTTNQPKVVFNKYVFINELRSFEVQKRQYLDGAYIMGQINQAVNHDAHKEVVAFKSTFTGPFENRMRLYSEFLDLHPECRDALIGDASIPREFKIYYDRFGSAYLKSLYWKESAIKCAMGKASTDIDLNSQVLNTFQVGSNYLLSDIKSALQYIYNNYQPGRTAKATDLEQWFIVKKVKATDNNGKRQRGYRIEGLK